MRFIKKGDFEWYNIRPNILLTLEGNSTYLDNNFIYLKPTLSSWNSSTSQSFPSY